MKSKTLKQKSGSKLSRTRKSLSGVLSDAYRFSRRHSAYTFVASLGVWLPKAEAATIVNLDATTQPLGTLTIWPNTGTLPGDFNSAGTVSPTVVSVDGVNGVVLLTGAPGAGTDGSHFVGPTAPAAVTGSGARTIEAWILDTNSLPEVNVFAYGRREGVLPDAFNNSFGHGMSPIFGAVGTFLDADLGWGNTAAQVATNVVIGRWTYIAQTFDGTTNAVYVDGRLANVEGPPNTALIDTAAVANDLSTPLPFRVARQNTAAGAISGTGDENITIGRIRVHDTALTGAQIQAQFDAEKGTFNLNDTDTDGMPDWWEVRYGLNKNSNADATTDLDGDGLNNLGEYNAGTFPNDTDTDNDGALDNAELTRVDPQSTLAAPTNPLDADSDDDGLLDGVETDTNTYVSPTNTGTDPLKGDTDGDIASDGGEIACGAEPTSAASTCGLTRAVDLDATALPGGFLTNWINTGTLVGNFASTNANTPSVVTNDGVKGIAFTTVGNGETGTHYVGPAVPAELTGAGARTVEAWVLNRTPQGEETVFGYGRRGGPDGTAFSLNHSTDPAFGAATHWGAGPDIGWADSPNLSYTRWNYIAYTYDGTTVRVYADGVLANSETTALSTFGVDSNNNPLALRVARQNDADGDPSNTGVGQITIAKVRVYTNALDGATIMARYNAEKAAFGYADPDGDGLPTWYEVRWGLNPNDATGNNGATGNQDNDGLTNLQEYQIGTAATVADTDGDGLNDGPETTRVDAGLPAPPSGAIAPTNPLNPDTDGDGLRDGAETDTGTFLNANNTGSDPLVVDSDGDTYIDGVEVSLGSNPVNALSIPDPGPRINLISTNLPPGLLSFWTNTGSFSNGMAFEATFGGGTVQTVQGVTALRMPGTGNTAPYYTGPTNPAAANLTGDPVYSMEAWVLNESADPAGEEIIMAWGRRGDNGWNNSFSHGTSAAFGAMGHWGGRDLGWNGVINFGRWTYLVYTYDALTSVQKAWVDGVQVNQETIADLLIQPVGTAGLAPMRIGAQNAATGAVINGDPGRAAGLSIAEVRVYNRVLGTNEIIAKFDAGKAAYGLGDNDQDGITDWFERVYSSCLSENNPNDANLDCDGDGLTNLQEFSNPNPAFAGIRTDPTNPDTDGDGIMDGEETNPTVRPFPTHPLDRDTDRDGLNDTVETGTGIYVSAANTGTTANFVDTDGDTFPDGTEVAYRLVDGVTDPNSGASMPNTATPVPLVKLDATGLTPGALNTWTNLSGLLNWDFVAPTSAVPNVEFVEGTRGVRFFNTNYYTGHGAPANLTGNGSRSVDAWIYNPAPRVAEETVFAWGRRDTALGNSAFSHGTSGPGTSPIAGGQFGAMQFFGDPGDVPWGPTAAAITSNVKTSQWTHVAYTYDNVTGIKACYADGVLAHSETNVVGTLLATFGSDNTAAAAALPFRVAAQNNADGLSDAAAPNLAIAKVRVYDLALSAAQIAATYNAERAQFPGAPRITNVKVNPVNGFVSFDWVPAPGRTYEVQRSTDAANPSAWSVIATGQGSGSYTNNPAGAPINFYRLRMKP